MPYIEKQRRIEIDGGSSPENAGELNYAISMMLKEYLKSKGGVRYSHVNEIVGVMDCAKMEFYRRVAIPYEDQKIEENGDVY